MSTFAQWWKAYQDGKGIRQITYVCGTEPVLSSAVTHAVWGGIGASGENTYVTLASSSGERDMWIQLDRRPIGSSPALSVIYEFENLNHPERLLDWVKRRKDNPSHHLILVSGIPAAPRVPVGDPKERKTELVPWLKFGAAGYVVECKAFTTATVKTAISWVRSITPMDPTVAGHLMNRADANLRLVRDTAEKLKVFPGTITQSVINDLLSAQPRDSFVDALLAMDKPEAYRALARVPKQDFSRIVGLLDAQLELAGMVYDSQLENRPRYELLKAAGSRAWLIPEIEKVAKHYDSKRRVRTRQLLLMADDVLSRGETEGVLEAVTALW